MSRIIWNLIGYGSLFYIWCYGMSHFSKVHPGWTGVFLIITSGFAAYKLTTRND